MQKSGVCFTLHTTNNTLVVFVFQALVLSVIDVLLFQGEMMGIFFGKQTFQRLRQRKGIAASSPL